MTGSVPRLGDSPSAADGVSGDAIRGERSEPGTAVGAPVEVPRLGVAQSRDNVSQSGGSLVFRRGWKDWALCALAIVIGAQLYKRGMWPKSLPFIG